jgi:hypothetical protein
VSESSYVLGRQRDEIVTRDAARETDLGSELDADPVVDVDGGGRETAMRDASRVEILHSLTDLLDNLELGSHGELMAVDVESGVQRLTLQRTHNETEMTSSHVEGDAHEELDALMSDLVQGSHLLAETPSVIATSGLSGYYLDTAVPVSTENGLLAVV